MRFTSDAVRSAMLLYAITDRSWLKPGESLTDVTARVLDAGATFLQIREKDLSPDRFEAEAEALRALCEKRRVPFVVNDNVEIALQCGADGVHPAGAVFSLHVLRTFRWPPFEVYMVYAAQTQKGRSSLSTGAKPLF